MAKKKEGGLVARVKNAWVSGHLGPFTQGADLTVVDAEGHASLMSTIETRTEEFVARVVLLLNITLTLALDEIHLLGVLLSKYTVQEICDRMLDEKDKAIYIRDVHQSKVTTGSHNSVK